jgi:molybdopterin synthase catalytic subunit
VVTARHRSWSEIPALRSLAVEPKRPAAPSSPFAQVDALSPQSALSLRITSDALDPADAMRAVADPAAGGSVLFAGTVRDHSDAGAVTRLEYEAWEDRAMGVMEAIGREMFDRWALRKVVLWHRFGSLDVGEVSVIVCVSAGHRGEAFDAARLGIERIKQDVPIWKKEHLPGGDAHWVRGS